LRPAKERQPETCFARFQAALGSGNLIWKTSKRQYKEASAAFHCCPNQHNREGIARLYDLKAA
jgi:hypothetical protein